MVLLLIQKINKLYSKLEKQQQHHDPPLPLLRAALQSFRSKVSSFVTTKLFLTPNPDAEILSLPWLHTCFQLLPIINQAFANLVIDLDYPMNKWEDKSVQEYLTHSLNLLAILNSISSSIASLGQSRLSLSHALSLVINGSPSSAVLHRLKTTTTATTTQLANSSRKAKDRQENGDGGVKNGSLCEREVIIHEALMEMKSVGFWVSSTVLACLSGDSKAYLEESVRPVSIACLNGIDSIILKEKEMILAKEVKDLNDSTARIAAEISSNRGVLGEAGEMQRKLEVFEKLLDGLRMDVDRLFSEILATRNELLRCFRHGKH
ncbi:UPF0496 protein 4 [Linum grandiflorum]